VGGYGTIATGKLLTDILAGALGLYSKAAPKYGSEKSGAPTNYYITLSPEPVKITNAEIEDVEIVISPDHKVFAHSNPLRGLVKGGTFILQTAKSPLDAWLDLPASARKAIREKEVRFLVVDAFAVASKNAPSAELTTRMMGIAFIGALCGHEPRITAGADREAILAKVRQQISKKFGSKGDAVVAGNMAVIADGAAATQLIDYNTEAFKAAEATYVPPVKRDVSVSAAICNLDKTAPVGLFDAEYYDDMMLTPFREGTISETPVVPGTGLFMPAGSAMFKDKGLFRRQVPLFDASKCTACLECTLVCPDAAMPSTVHEIDDLVATAARQIDVSEDRRAAIVGKVPAIASAIREVYKSQPKARAFHEVFAQVAPGAAAGDASLALDFDKMTSVLENFPVTKSRLFFDQPEKAKPGTGGLYSVGLDPWKCSGCLECTTVCGSDALVQVEQDDALLEKLQARFEFLTKTANTPARFTTTLTGANAKRLVLDRDNYYAMTGGHGGCRGCGEVTALRLIMAANKALHGKTRKEHIAEVESLIAKLADKAPAVAGDAARAARVAAAKAQLEKHLYMLESGPTGEGPAASIVANATGCTSVYSSTFPFNPYKDPWVNSLFQDTPAVAKGLFEGVAADVLDDFKAIRIAELELEDGYDAAVHDKFFRTFTWEKFTDTELARLPSVFSVGGDGATYDIGFGALSRLLATRTPIKVVVVNTGVYSNTGGQASTSTLIGQDSDLARFGSVHPGKTDDRKELGLIAAFHPGVHVVQTATPMQGHFLKNVLAALARTSAPAIIDVYTPCQGEQGISDDVSSEHARLAVESRTSPVYVHNPDGGATLNERFSIDGNPDSEQDWTTLVLTYKDADGNEQTKEVPLTPAHFARKEGRFKKAYAGLKPLSDEVNNAVSIDEFIDLSAEERADKVAFIWEVKGGKLVRFPVPAPIVALVEERRRFWRTLQNLAGIEAEKVDEAHKAEIEALQTRYNDALATIDELKGASSSAAE
jgi:pyruvate-ferredoxin/flavodoxin oxidoreductase